MPRFLVGITSNGFGRPGRLEIGDDGSVSVESRSGRAYLGGVVTIAHLRLLPPFVSCAIPVIGQDGVIEAVARFPIWMRATIRQALKSANRDVVDIARWLTLPDRASAAP
jgi:hypothetical protein